MGFRLSLTLTLYYR